MNGKPEALTKEGVSPPSFLKELQALLNHWSQENVSNTPDFILAEFIGRCLFAYNLATHDRDKWYGVDLRPGRRTGHDL